MDHQPCLKSDTPGDRNGYRLLLFVGKDSGRSAQARRNIRQICDRHLQGAYGLETINVHEHPEIVREYQVLAVPTLIKQSPPPLKRIVGDLSAERDVLAALDIFPEP